MVSVLTVMVLRHRKGQVALETLVDESLKYIYVKLRRDFWGTEEEWHDYVSDCVPRIKKAIQLFHFNGSNFESYLAVSIKYHIRSYYKKNHSDGNPVVTSMNDDCEFIGCCDPEPTLKSYSLNTSIINHNFVPFHELPVFSKRIIIYVILNSNYVGDRFIAILADKTRCDPNWLLNKRNEVLAIIFPLKETRSQLIQKNQYYLSKLQEIQVQLKDRVVLKEYQIAELTRTEESLYRRISNLSVRIGKIKLIPYHSQLADIIGIPKGTIDSSLFYLRNHWTTTRSYLNEILEEL